MKPLSVGLSAIAIAVASVCASGLSRAAESSAWPARSVRFIVPFAPASGTDITAGLFADRLSSRWGKPVVIENRPGGDGLVAINAFTGAANDHVLLFVPVGTFAVHPYVQEKVPYDAERDLLPIASFTTLFLAVSTSTSLKVANVADFVALARAQPGQLNAAATAGGAEFLLAGFLRASGVDVVRVPYRDILQAPNDLAEGRLSLAITSLAVAQPHMQAGRVRVLAVTSRQRAPSAPDVPTAAQAGFPSLELESLVGLFGPRGMPIELREQIADAVRQVGADPAVGARLAATGQVVDVRGPREFAAGVEDQRSRLAAIARLIR